MEKDCGGAFELFWVLRQLQKGLLKHPEVGAVRTMPFSMLSSSWPSRSRRHSTILTPYPAYAGKLWTSPNDGTHARLRDS